jgi:hypothetical protein
VKKRLYDKNYHLNENGKELSSRLIEATKEIVDEFLGMGYDAHDIERVGHMSICNSTLLHILTNK